jgi:glycerol kinase
MADNSHPASEPQRYIGAIDQGTTSTRFMVFDHTGAEVGRHQLEHDQILPQAGWVEHDAKQIWQRTREVIRGGLRASGITGADLAAVGITNQRETTVVWDARTGRPYANAIVWQDTRTDGIVKQLESDGHGDLIRTKTGLPPAAYFSGGKVKWLLDNVSGLRADAEAGHALFGTMDTWVIWNLTGEHVTDVTNASRTMLMDLETLGWDDELLELFGVPKAMLPRIASSSEVYGSTRASGAFDAEVPVSGDLGDQQAALVGQACFAPGTLKNTYGTGNFVVLNTGENIVRSSHGLLTTLAYKLGDAPAVYALEGSIAVTGSAVQWLRDQLGIIEHSADVEMLAMHVPDNGGVAFVPAFSGLFAPYWRSDARGVIVGLSRFNTKDHLARATLESICHQSVDVVDAMVADAELQLTELKVDGGVTMNNLCMQIQSDLLGVDVVRPKVSETTALGAAYAAGLAVGFWKDTDEVAANWAEDKRWTPTIDDNSRSEARSQWAKAVERTYGWV